MKILGIDPSINHSGWALIEHEFDLCKYIDGGVIICNQKLALSQKLSKIYKFLENILIKEDICYVAMEKSFVNVNALTSLKLAYARGVVMALVGHNEKVQFREYSPTYIKKTIVGKGHAKKEQIAYILKFLINNLPNKIFKLDHTDAVAIAYTCAQVIYQEQFLQET